MKCILLLFCLSVAAWPASEASDSYSSLLLRLLEELEVENIRERRQSWDSYIDNLIAQSKDASGNAHCDTAAIIGVDGGAKWTTDAQANALKVTQDEATTISKAFKARDFTPFMTDGITIAGTKYQFLREEDSKVVYGKKKGSGAITLQASKTAIVMAHTPEGSQQGNCNKGVSVIAEYLEGLGM